MAYDNDSELRIAITTDAELSALKRGREELQRLLRTMDDGSAAAKDLANQIKQFDNAVESGNAKLIERREQLEQIIKIGAKVGADISKESAEYDQLSQKAEEAGVSLGDFSNAAQVASSVMKEGGQNVKVFGLGFRQLNRSMSAFTKYVPGLSLALRFVSGGALATMASIMLLGTAFEKLMQHFKKGKEEAEKLAKALEEPTVDAYKAATAAQQLATEQTAKMTERLKEQAEYFPTLAEKMALYKEQVRLDAEEAAAVQKQQHERELQELNLLHEQKLISEEDYFKRSQQLSLRASEQKRQAEMDALRRQIEEKAEAVRISQAWADEAGKGLGGKRGLLAALVKREGGRITSTEDLRKQAGALLGRGDKSVWALGMEAADAARAAEFARINDPTGYFVQKTAAKSQKANDELERARNELKQLQDEIAQRERDDKLKAATAADIARQEKRVAGAEDDADKYSREKAALEALIPLRERANSLQRERDKDAADNAEQMRALRQNPGILPAARQAAGIVLGGRGTGAQMAAVAALGSPQALLAGGGSGASMMQFAAAAAMRRQALVVEMNDPHTTKQRREQIQKELDKLDASLGTVSGSGAWTETLARQYPGFLDGGYTGDGPRNEIAGLVHKGEIVIPADVVRRMPKFEDGTDGEPAPGWIDQVSGQMPGAVAGTLATAALGGGGVLIKSRSRWKDALKKLRRKINFDRGGAPSPEKAKALKLASKSSGSMAELTEQAWASNLAQKAPPVPIGSAGKGVTDRMLSSGGWSMLEHAAPGHLKIAALLAASKFVKAIPNTAARLAASAGIEYALTEAGGRMSVEPITNVEGTLADTSTFAGGAYSALTDAAAAAPFGGGGVVPAMVGGLLAREAVAGHGIWSETLGGKSTESQVRVAQAFHPLPANMPAGYSPVIHRRPDVAQKLRAARSAATRSAAEAALARANAAVAGSYSFGPAGANDRADQAARDREAQERAAAIARSEDAARARAASERRADELRMRDARAGNFTGLTGHQALAFYMEQASIVAQSVSTLQADMESRLKNARGAF